MHAKINRIPYQDGPHTFAHKRVDTYETYTPTRWHKINAFRVIWWDELKRSFWLK